MFLYSFVVFYIIRILLELRNLFIHMKRRYSQDLKDNLSLQELEFLYLN